MVCSFEQVAQKSKSDKVAFEQRAKSEDKGISHMRIGEEVSRQRGGTAFWGNSRGWSA